MWRHRNPRWGRRGWLRPWVLGILARTPRNGVEIMDQIEQMSLGWRPSPGSVYPLLEELVAEGLVRRRDDGRYEATRRGQETGAAGPWELFAHPPPTVKGVLDEMRANTSYLEDLRSGRAEEVTPHLKAIRELADRLGRLASS